MAAHPSWDAPDIGHSCKIGIQLKPISADVAACKWMLTLHHHNISQQKSKYGRRMFGTVPQKSNYEWSSCFFSKSKFWLHPKAHPYGILWPYPSISSKSNYYNQSQLFMFQPPSWVWLSNRNHGYGCFDGSVAMDQNSGFLVFKCVHFINSAIDSKV